MAEHDVALTISLLGGVAIKMNGTPVSGFVSRKVEGLLIYLAANPRPHARDILATLFWPDHDQARALANFSVALSNLRKQLGAYVVADRHTVGFHPEMPFWLDAAEFERAVMTARAGQQKSGQITRAAAAGLAPAVALYQGDFLAGFTVRGAPSFETWVLLEQERLRQLLLAALADLVTFQGQRGQFETAIGYAQRSLAVDPLQESVHRQLMTLFVQSGQRAAALAQYEQCAASLTAELDIEPEDATTALYEQIISGQYAGPTTAAEPAAALAGRHNLPVSSTSFIGREAELAQIDAWLAAPDGRLLTILGPGGMGKTRLATEAARAYRGQFSGGVWVVSLVPFSDTASVITAVAEAIDFTLARTGEPAAQLLGHLQTQEMLLVLDNLEHLLDPPLRAFISQLTARAPELRLIATSRERLNLAAEAVLALSGLSFPESAAEPAGLADYADAPGAHAVPGTYAAAVLFVNRARRVQPGFNPAGQAESILELCQLVGGLPLALELAATWTSVLGVAEIVAEIRRGLDVLATTLHDVPERHRSLRAVVDSSWDLLGEGERAFFRQLAVFRGGFTRAAAQQVARATLPQLMALVDRSFLRLDEDQRFRRHPLLLQFAQEQLAARPVEQAAAAAAHAATFADFVQTHEPRFHGPDNRAVGTLIGADLENIRVAWHWGLAQMNEALLDRLLPGLSRFLGDRARTLEAVDLFENSLAHVGAQAATAERDRIAAKIGTQLGYFLHQSGRLVEADAVLQEAETLTQQHDLAQTRITCLRVRGVVADDQGRREDARELLEEAQLLCQTHGDVNDLLPILNALGNTYVSLAEFDRARGYFEAAMDLAAAQGNVLRIAVLRGNLAIIANRQKDYHEAIRQWELAQEGFREHNHMIGLANTIFNIAMAYTGLEQYDEGLKRIQQAYSLLEELGQRQGMAGGLGVIGMIYNKMGKMAEARRHLYGAAELAQEIGSASVAIYSLAEVAELEINSGNMKQAVMLLSFVHQHPATGGLTVANTQRLLDELTTELPATLVAEAKAAAQTYTLDSLVAELCGRPGRA